MTDPNSVNIEALRAKLRRFVSSEQPVTFNAYYSFDNLISEAVEAVRKDEKNDIVLRNLRAHHADRRAVPDYPDMTITSKELDDAYARNGLGSPQAVTDLLLDIRRNREPEWKPGDVVKAADGTIWFRANARSPWQRPGLNAGWDHHVPKRPLKLLGNGTA